LEDLEGNGRMTLRWILKEKDVRVVRGWSCPRNVFIVFVFGGLYRAVEKMSVL
jgi:hypothetical protein